MNDHNADDRSIPEENSEWPLFLHYIHNGFVLEAYESWIPGFQGEEEYSIDIKPSHCPGKVEIWLVFKENRPTFAHPFV